MLVEQQSRDSDIDSDSDRDSDGDRDSDRDSDSDRVSDRDSDRGVRYVEGITQLEKYVNYNTYVISR